MKRNNAINASYVKFFRKFLFSVIIFISIVQDAPAQESHKVSFPDGSFTFNGNVGDHLIFHLKLANSESDKIIVSISNNRGDKLFHSAFKEKAISKIFRISDELETLTLTVSNTNKKTEQQFKINAQRRYVDDVLVTRIN